MHRGVILSSGPKRLIAFSLLFFQDQMQKHLHFYVKIKLAP